MEGIINSDEKLKQEGLFLKFFNYIKHINKNKSLNRDLNYEVAELIDNINDAKAEWINANTNFEYVDDMDIIDYYTYKIKASQLRYEYFLKKAKEKGLRVETPREIAGVSLIKFVES